MSNIQVSIPSLGDKFIDRREDIWGNSYTWSWERPLDQVKNLVIHHSVTIHEATPDDIALLHKARGWGGIGYHFVIDKEGKVSYVGDIGTARANVLNKNEMVIGICLIGDFTKHLPSDEQITSAHKLCTRLIEIFPEVKDWDDVVGHKGVQATACPGTSWNGELGGMKDRIEKNIIYTAPDPVEEVDVDLAETLDGYKNTIYRLKEILRIPVGDNSEDVVGRVLGLVDRVEKLEKAQEPMVIYKVGGKDFESVFKIGNLRLIIEKG